MERGRNPRGDREEAVKKVVPGFCKVETWQVESVSGRGGVLFAGDHPKGAIRVCSHYGSSENVTKKSFLCLFLGFVLGGAFGKDP